MKRKALFAHGARETAIPSKPLYLGFLDQSLNSLISTHYNQDVYDTALSLQIISLLFPLFYAFAHTFLHQLYL